MSTQASNIDPTTGALLAEFDQEGQTTRRVLETVPPERYDYRPNEKARSMGELCQHIATVPGAMAQILGGESFDLSHRPDPDGSATSREDLIKTFDENMRSAREWLEGLGSDLYSTWRLEEGEREIMSVPRVGAIRMLLFNHLYHHRGQLAAYLRSAGEFVPSIYGPSADEDPFGAG